VGGTRVRPVPAVRADDLLFGFSGEGHLAPTDDSAVPAAVVDMHGQAGLRSRTG
jgi:hypothetical protein